MARVRYSVAGNARENGGDAKGTGAHVTKTHLSDQFVLAVKDQLRNVRYQIRRSAEGGGPRPHRFAPHVPRPVALAAASVFSQVEAAATALLPENEHHSGALAFPQPISAYFGPEAVKANALAPEIYYVLKGLLRRFGLEVFLVSEQAVDEAVGALKGRSAALAAVALDGSRPSSERIDATVRLCAALSAELAAARPIREMMTSPSREPAPKNLARAPNDYCALMVGLAVALASKSDANVGDLDALIVSADLAVDARFAELSAALGSANPTSALAREFAAMIPFLP
jgi:hypothetical protein